MILLAVSCLFFVSCTPKPAPVVEAEETVCPMMAMLEKWDTFADLDEEGQVALIAEAKALFDAKYEENKECEAEECAEKCPEKEAECAAFKAKWEDFANLPMEEQKALLDQAFECVKKCCKDKEEGEGCCKDKEETCEK
jgi:hypothetical protein